MLSPSPSIASTKDASSAPNQARIAKATTEFEAMFLSQMLRTARESEDEGSATGPMREVAEEQFGLALAQSGGLGLAKTIAARVTPLEQGVKTGGPQGH